MMAMNKSALAATLAAGVSAATQCTEKMDDLAKVDKFRKDVDAKTVSDYLQDQYNAADCIQTKLEKAKNDETVTLKEQLGELRENHCPKAVNGMKAVVNKDLMKAKENVKKAGGDEKNSTSVQGLQKKLKILEDPSNFCGGRAHGLADGMRAETRRDVAAESALLKIRTQNSYDLKLLEDEDDATAERLLKSAAERLGLSEETSETVITMFIVKKQEGAKEESPTEPDGAAEDAAAEKALQIIREDEAAKKEESQFSEESEDKIAEAFNGMDLQAKDAPTARRLLESAAERVGLRKEAKGCETAIQTLMFIKRMRDWLEDEPVDNAARIRSNFASVEGDDALLKKLPKLGANLDEKLKSLFMKQFPVEYFGGEAWKRMEDNFKTTLERMTHWAQELREMHTADRTRLLLQTGPMADVVGKFKSDMQADNFDFETEMDAALVKLVEARAKSINEDPDALKYAFVQHEFELRERVPKEYQKLITEPLKNKMVTELEANWDALTNDDSFDIVNETAGKDLPTGATTGVAAIRQLAEELNVENEEVSDLWEFAKAKAELDRTLQALPTPIERRLPHFKVLTSISEGQRNTGALRQSLREIKVEVILKEKMKSDLETDWEELKELDGDKLAKKAGLPANQMNAEDMHVQDKTLSRMWEEALSEVKQVTSTVTEVSAATALKRRDA